MHISATYDSKDTRAKGWVKLEQCKDADLKNLDFPYDMRSFAYTGVGKNVLLRSFRGIGSQLLVLAYLPLHVGRVKIDQYFLEQSYAEQMRNL